MSSEHCVGWPETLRFAAWETKAAFKNTCITLIADSGSGDAMNLIYDYIYSGSMRN